MADRHKVFISYHHAGDQLYKERFVQLFSSVMVDWSVRLGDIQDGLATEYVRQKIRNEWLRDSTVTVVLVGRQTWQRKHVDWEIGSSLRSTAYSPRSGVMGVVLPTYPEPPGRYEPSTVPPRLADNLTGTNPFAKLYNWTESPSVMESLLHDAFTRRNQNPPPDNSRDSFGCNRTGDRWSN